MQASCSGQKAASSDPASLMRSHTGQALACSAVRADCQKPEASTEKIQKQNKMTRDAARLFKREIQEASGSGCAIKRKKNGPSGRCAGTRSKSGPGERTANGLAYQGICNAAKRHLRRIAPSAFPPPRQICFRQPKQRGPCSFLCAIVRQGFIQPLQQGCQRSLIAGGQTLA